MTIKEILQSFIDECKNHLDLEAILQFGSSTYSKDFNDIDLLFLFRGKIVSAKEIFKLIELIKKFEEMHKEIVFDFGGTGTRKRVAKNNITIALMSQNDLEVAHNPHDIFFFKNLKEDKNIKILYGKDPLGKFKFFLSNQHIFEMLSVDLKHTLRKNLEDKADSESLCHLFKTLLRGMLINKGVFKKEELLKKFKTNFESINLPNNSQKILNHEIAEGDFYEIVKFAEDCLRYLSK